MDGPGTPVSPERSRASPPSRLADVQRAASLLGRRLEGLDEQGPSPTPATQHGSSTTHANRAATSAARRSRRASTEQGKNISRGGAQSPPPESNGIELGDRARQRPETDQAGTMNGRSPGANGQPIGSDRPANTIVVDTTNLQLQLAERGHELRELKAKLQQRTEEMTVLESELKLRDASMADLRKRESALLSETERLEAAVGALAETKSKLEKKQENLKKDIPRLEQDIDDKKDKKKKLQEEEAILNTEIMKKQKLLKQQKGEIGQLDSQLRLMEVRGNPSTNRQDVPAGHRSERRGERGVHMV
ncbi:hypothetical protein B0T18DRAFT_174640 [Schizothecium vesticola]|uniref:Uncharacterized protein n=1 Tax=Schizothecium vesticola TaxID=314040 RepID=A0AA40EPF9_9PEZI|nr:hypothetical protein B0T18DRAFT_174640 [Schizothecium vesticola]